jgi:rhodanese-related sulfurtransferase
MWFSKKSESSSFKRISADDLNRMLADNATPFLLDVREPSELKAFGAIPGVVNIPLGQLQSQLAKLPADHDSPIVAICQSGGRSQSAARLLLQQGYTNVYNLDGGTMGWLRSKSR